MKREAKKMEFDKKILLDNINYLRNKKRMRIQDLEDKIGVSKGYISRIKKKNRDAALPVEIAKKIADVLDISVDTLISLEKRTDTREIKWKKIDTDELYRYLSGDIPPRKELVMFRDTPKSIQNIWGPLIIKSLFFEGYLYQGTKFCPPCPWFEFELDDKNILIITHTYIVRSENDYTEVFEAYIYTETFNNESDKERTPEIDPHYALTPFCSSVVSSQEVCDTIASLYRTVLNHQNDIQFNDEIKKLLDKYNS